MTIFYNAFVLAYIWTVIKLIMTGTRGHIMVTYKLMPLFCKLGLHVALYIVQSLFYACTRNMYCIIVRTHSQCANLGLFKRRQILTFNYCILYRYTQELRWHCIWTCHWISQKTGHIEAKLMYESLASYIPRPSNISCNFEKYCKAWVRGYESLAI